MSETFESEMKAMFDRCVVSRVSPGDRVLVVIPSQSTQATVDMLNTMLHDFAPDAHFMVMAGALSITTIPASDKRIFVPVTNPLKS